MAYKNKKKRYKLNKNVRKAQGGDVVDAISDLAGNFGGGEGIPLGDIWEGVVDTITNLNLGNINLPSIGGGGGGGSDDNTPSNKTNPNAENVGPSFFDRSYSKLSGDELRNAYGNHYDFGRHYNQIDHDANPSANRFKSGRHSNWSSLFHTPENVNFDFTDEQGRKSGPSQNSHPSNLSAMLMDIGKQDPEAIKWLINNSHQYAPRSNAVSDLNKKHGFEKGALGLKDRRYLRDIDQEKLDRENERLRKAKSGEYGVNYKGHAYDVDMMNQLFGKYLPKGMTIDSQMADMMHDFAESKMFTDAMASMNPDFFDPGVKGIDEKGNYGAYTVRQNVGTEEMDQFINAPINYQYNMEASGLNPNQKPSQDWLRMQYMSNQGANKDGMGGYNKNELIQMLMQDEEFLAKNNLDRGDLGGTNLGYAQTSGDLYRFGVEWDDKNKKWYSQGTKDFLTPEQAEKWTSQIASQYVDNSGWQQYNPTSSIDPVNIGNIPSSKIDTTINKPTGVMSFDQSESDIGNDINEIQGGVEVGAVTGGEELDSDGNPVVVGGGDAGGDADAGGGSSSSGGGSGVKRSMDAIINSVSSGTHVGTGDDYNQSDLKRDAAIIKKEFGNDAYNDLMNQISNIDPIEPGSNQSVVNDSSSSSRPIRRNAPSFVNTDDEDSFVNRNNDDEEEMSLGEYVDRMRNPENYDDEDDTGDNNDSSQDNSSSDEVQVTPSTKKIGKNLYYGSGFAGDSGMSQQQQEEMMNMGITPIYKHGGFGKDFNMDKMKFYKKGGKTLYANEGADLSQVAKAFSANQGGGSGVSGGFNIAPIYNTAAKDPIQAGDTYLSMKIMRIEKELTQLDPNVDQEAMAALMQEIEESKAELIAIRGGGVGANRG